MTRPPRIFQVVWFVPHPTLEANMPSLLPKVEVDRKILSALRNTNDENPSPPSFGFNLPSDISNYLLTVLQESCDRSTLFHLSLVNKQFYQIFSPLVYERIEISEWNMRKVFAGMILDAVESEEYLERPAMRLIREPKPTVSDEEITESLGCLAMCFGPRKPKPETRLASGAEGQKKKMSSAELAREVDKIQDERRERDYERYDGTSFGRDLISIWNRKKKLLNSVKHLRIRDIVAAREIAAYLGPTIKEQRSQSELHSSTSLQMGGYEKPEIFQSVRYLSFGFELLSSDKQSDVREPIHYGELAGLHKPPSSLRTMDRLMTKLRTTEVCGRWNVKQKMDRDKMVFTRDLECMCGVWKVERFTWHVYQRDELQGGHRKIKSSDNTDGRKIYQSHVIDSVEGIPNLQIVYTDICNCQVGCSRSHLGVGGNEDECWRELGYAALKIDHLGYGTTEDDHRAIELVGLPCLTSVTPDDMTQAALEIMDKMGFDGTEISLAERRWQDRYKWTRDHLLVIPDLEEGRCRCCERIQEDKFGIAFSMFGRKMRAL
ncbi:hypothetical protein I203_106948 [Kwoniella mangroviensis CBS 8507]|uniref:hypothetical protein n=1 Tax=Kwoniella mangroviensis CBS 8507 TaxID=1296122 RepID=UPI00080D44DB|nr:uncharacterized protein I203_08138 [Kwoniella mangroviensis CBS 8507]OCF62823.1 hypothetical protein I203_08138 [Kwoniella mangroviensis CBS 8507]